MKRDGFVVRSMVAVVSLVAAGAVVSLMLSNGDTVKMIFRSGYHSQQERSSPRRRTTTTVRHHHHPSSSSTSMADNALPHVVEHDLKYRRVCAEVHSSMLCMTLRFPFDVPLQSKMVNFPFPVDDRFYQLSKASFLVDGPALEDCRQHDGVNGNTIKTMTERVRACLEKEALRRPNQVVVVFTRRSMVKHNNHGEDFYGTKSMLQQERLYNFFRDHDVVVVGDSLSPPVTQALAELFQTCSPSVIQHLEEDFTCRAPAFLSGTTEDSTTVALQQQRERHMETAVRQGNSISSNKNSIHLLNIRHTPDVYRNIVNGHRWQIANYTKPLLDVIRDKAWVLRGRNNKASSDDPQQNKLRPLAILMEYPFAHTQNQYMMHESFVQIQYNQQRMVELLMEITTPKSRATLQQDFGLELSHVIAFDGFPQHFPTETSGYVETTYRNQEDFVKGNGYDGWQSKYGSSCRGPVPPNSLLSRINHQQRQNFHRSGLDMKKWYGKTWEFTNQFWWEESMWAGGDVLDCTHPRLPQAGGPRVWKYFLQAMVDGHYETH